MQIMQIIIRFFKLLTYIPLVLLVMLYILFVLLVVYPINYIVKGPDSFQKSIFSDLAYKFGIKMDNWFKEK